MRIFKNHGVMLGASPEEVFALTGIDLRGGLRCAIHRELLSEDWSFANGKMVPSCPRCFGEPPAILDVKDLFPKITNVSSRRAPEMELVKMEPLKMPRPGIFADKSHEELQGIVARADAEAAVVRMKAFYPERTFQIITRSELRFLGYELDAEKKRESPVGEKCYILEIPRRPHEPVRPLCMAIWEGLSDAERLKFEAEDRMLVLGGTAYRTLRFQTQKAACELREDVALESWAYDYQFEVVSESSVRLRFAELFRG